MGIELDSGSGGSTLATDTVSAEEVQRICIGYGVEDTWTRVNAGAGFPVSVDSFGTGIDQGAGGVGSNTQRVTIANDDALLTTIDADTSAMKTALEIIDDWDESDRAKTNPIAGQAGIAANAGNMDALTTRVVIATNDTHFGTVGTASDIDGVIHGQLRYIADQLVTIDSDTNDVKTAIELLDNAVDGNYLNVNVNLAGTDVVDGAGNDAAGVQRVVIATDDVNLSAMKTALEIMDDWDDGSDHCEVAAVSVVPGTAATNLGKARASALGATDTGVAPLAVRNDDLADLAGADGDYTPVQVDSKGAVYVNQAAAELHSASGIAAGGAADEMIAQVAGKKLLIVAMSLVATSTTTNNVYVNNDDNDLYGNAANPIPMSMDADGDTIAGITLDYNPAGWFKTDTVNEAVTLTGSAAQDIIWSVSWIETD